MEEAGRHNIAHIQNLKSASRCLAQDFDMNQVYRVTWGAHQYKHGERLHAQQIHRVKHYLPCAEKGNNESVTPDKHMPDT